MVYNDLDVRNLIEVDSVSSYIGEIKNLKSDLDGSSAELYFRGQETEYWNIEPSIFRDNMLSIEHKLMQIPLQKIPSEFKDLYSKFDIMTKYQHYGMCTRLLDLTTNPLVALYFACKKNGAKDYAMESGNESKEPYGVVYYTNKFYPSQAKDLEVRIISELASYDLSKENKICDIFDKLQGEKIIDEGQKDKWLKDINTFINIIQNNYMVMPTYSNERLKKQSGVFLISSMFSVTTAAKPEDYIITKTKGNLRDCFCDKYFYVRGENKDEILRELDLYNINEATLFPELEHQLNYIKSFNKGNASSVSDFYKYSENDTADKNEIITNVDLQKINDNIMNEFETILGGTVETQYIDDIKKIVQENMVVDWYKRETILSRLKITLSGYFFTKTKNKTNSIKVSEMIVDKMSDYVKQYYEGNET